MVARLPLLAQLSGGEYKRVDLPSECRLLIPEQWHDLLERDLFVPRNDHQVHVAGLALLAAGEGPEDEGYRDSIGNSAECVTKTVNQASAADYKLLERLKQR